MLKKENYKTMKSQQLPTALTAVTNNDVLKRYIVFKHMPKALLE